MNTQNLPLDKHLLLQFKSGLEEQHRELLDTIEKGEQEIRDLAGQAPLDAIDDSCIAASKESLFSRASRNRSRLRLIQRALQRISDRSYGICVDCEGLIGLKRLQAVPWASHCIHCQEQAELTRSAGTVGLHLPLTGGSQASGA